MSIFSHVNLPTIKGTIAMVLPTKMDLSNVFEQHATATLVMLGISLVHPEDRFNRAVGREVSGSRLTYQVAKLCSVEIRGTKHIYHFTSELPDTSSPKKTKKLILFGVSTTKEVETVKLSYATFGETQQ